MTIASEITKLNTNLTNSYTACQSKGATMPTNQNFDNLATCIGSIQTGSTPTLITKNITQNGTYNASSDNADGYSSVTVNVSGGGSGTTYSYPDIQGNYYVLDDETVVPMCFDEMMFSGGTYRNGLLIVETLSGFTIADSSLTLKRSILTSGQCSNIFMNNDGILGQRTVKHISIGFPNTAITQISFSGTSSGGGAFSSSNVFSPYLQSVRISNMNNLILNNAFKNCSHLTEVDVSTVDSMPLSLALGGTASVGGAFTYCTSLQTLSFNSLKSTSFSNKTNQFNNMLKGVTGCTVHFPSNLQSVIGSWSSVTSGFGGTNTTVLFDLPATT